MQSGALAKKTGGLSEKRAVRFAADYFGIPVEDVLIQTLTPDASTRRYYRLATKANSNETFIASVYPPPFNALENTFIDVTHLFEQAGLPVPKIIAVADLHGIILREQLRELSQRKQRAGDLDDGGVILQEDLGDMSLAKWLGDAGEKGDVSSVEEMLHRSIELIARIQSATELSRAMNSCSSHLAFDEEKLSWELNYFFTNFFGSYRQHQFTSEEAEAIHYDLRAIAAELAARPRVLTHRDYHAMNLMVDGRGELRVIDHQDARMGPATYDLVPLLVERRLQPADDAWVEEHQGLFLRLRDKLRLPKIETGDFRYEFDLMTVQRQLKAMGTFSYQTAVVGRGVVYEKYIVPAAATVLRAMTKPGMKEYPALRKALEGI